jgi:hypothetical protein
MFSNSTNDVPERQTIADFLDSEQEAYNPRLFSGFPLEGE